MTSPRRYRRAGLTLVELLVVIAIIGLLMALLLPAVQAVREAARRTQCQSNLRQIGIALHAHEQARRSLPSGWIAFDTTERPGWSWAAQILPFIEEDKSVFQSSGDLQRPIDDARFAAARVLPLSLLLCPSDDAPLTFNPPQARAIDPSQRLTMAAAAVPGTLEVARANFAAVHGVRPVEEAPDRGLGAFFRNSRVRLAQLPQGTNKTLLVGERSSRLGGTTWTGVVPGADRALARIVGSTERVPNDVLGDIGNFSSYHVGGANFLNGDSSVQQISDEVDLRLFRTLSTRDGYLPPDNCPTAPGGDGTLAGGPTSPPPAVAPPAGVGSVPPPAVTGSPPGSTASGSGSQPTGTSPTDSPPTGTTAGSPTSGQTGSPTGGGSTPGGSTGAGSSPTGTSGNPGSTPPPTSPPPTTAPPGTTPPSSPPGPTAGPGHGDHDDDKGSDDGKRFDGGDKPKQTGDGDRDDDGKRQPDGDSKKKSDDD